MLSSFLGIGGNTLDVSSKAKGGKLIPKNGGILNMANNTTLTIDGALRVFVDNESTDLSEIFSFGENARICVAGAETKEEAYRMLSNMIKFDGFQELLTTLTDATGLSQYITAIPEAAEWAATMGKIALSFIIYPRKRY